jgi:hypothetical protein
MRLPSLLIASLLFAVSGAIAQVEFEGIPSVFVQVQEGTTRSVEISSSRVPDLRVKITQEGAQYIWASRNNLTMSKTESGVYITYTATNGAGYVRVLNPMMRKALESLPPEQRAKEFVYMEHLVNRLGSITYFGR